MDNWYRFFTSANVFIYRLSGGRIGNKLGRQSVLILHTIGRKSGKEYATTLSYYRDGENYLVVGSNWGKESQPGWYHNLIQQPRNVIQVDKLRLHVVARRAEGDEYQRLWQLVTHLNSQYSQYQKTIQRRIPIVILTPIKNH